MRIEINDKKVTKALDNLTAKLRNRALRKGCRSAAKVFQKEVKSNIKQTTDRQSGDLRREVKVRSLKGRKNIGARVIINLPYAAHLEYGAKGINIAPREFMTDAFESKVDQAKRKLIDSILVEIRNLGN